MNVAISVQSGKFIYLLCLGTYENEKHAGFNASKGERELVTAT
jgi:hypothetical protein